MEELFADVGRQPGVLSVTSPYNEEGAQQVSAQGPEAGLIAYANVDMPSDIAQADAKEISTYIEDHAPDLDGLTVERVTLLFAEDGAPSAEAFGLAFAIIILVLAFGSVLAMGLPVGVALSGIGIGTSIVILLSHLLAVPEFATILGIMIGLGVGIDYALLIVTRYREQLHAGHTVRESVTTAIDTAGRSVVFGGCTVVISLLSMMLIGVTFVQSLAITASAVVAVTILASVTLLPALLGFAGRRVELTRWRGLIAAGLAAVGMFGLGLKIVPLAVAGFLLALVVLAAGLFAGPLQREVPMRAPKPKQETFAYRWSRVVQRRPWFVAIVATVVLLVLTVPVLALRLGFSRART